MSDRKATPDLLGDILNAPASTFQKTTPADQPMAVSPAQSSSPTPAASSARLTWEYKEVVFREFLGWRPRAIDGRELDDWKEQPVIVDYLKILGEDGWEMVGIMENRRNTRSIYFKRPIAA